MSLTIVPLKNHLATSSNPYYVHTLWSDTIEYDKLVDIMAAGRTTLTKPDIAGCLELFTEEIMKLVADGKYVKTRMGAFYLCASGKLDAPDQAFTPRDGTSEHDLRLHFRADKSLEAGLLATAKIERGERYDRNTPIVFSVVSVRTGDEMKASAGDFLRVVGQRLKIDPADESEGLFFVNGHETRAVQYAAISPGLVIAQLPEGLAPGSYYIAVRSHQGGKELHEGRSPAPFIVE
jgi:hypothetical protein